MAIGALLVVLVAGATWLTADRDPLPPPPPDPDPIGEKPPSDRRWPPERDRAGVAAEISLPLSYAGEVPAPAAHHDWQSSQSFLGQALEKARIFFGTHQPFMESTHVRQERHPHWAAAMEAILRQRFSPAILAEAGLGGMTLESVDCRTSICRLEVVYPGELAADFPGLEARRDLDFGGRTVVIGADGPIEHLLSRTGPLAGTTGLIPGRPAREAGWRGRGLVLIFSAREIDPEGYPRWVREVHTSWLAARPPR